MSKREQSEYERLRLSDGRLYVVTKISWVNFLLGLRKPNRPGCIEEGYPGQAYFHKYNENIKRAELNWMTR